MILCLTFSIPEFNVYDSIKEVGPYGTFIESVITNYTLKNKTPQGKKAFLAYQVVPMRTKEFIHDLISASLYANMICFFYIMCGAIMMMNLVIRLQTEKNNKIRELMRTMGMMDTAYYLSYFLFHMIISCITMLMGACLLRFFILNNISILLTFIFGLLLMANAFAFSLIVKY